MESTARRVATLNPVDAFALWEKGEKAWNIWVKDNPKYNINFAGSHFTPSHKNTQNGEEHINFGGFVFPAGNISFKNTAFDGGFVTFSGVDFGNSNVDFSGAKFRCYRVSFVRCNFSGHVQFSQVDFGDTSVDFRGANFSGSSVHFLGAKFKGEFTHFGSSNFGHANVDFRNAQFGNGNTYFENTDFSNVSMLNFNNSTFDGGEVSFKKTKLPSQNILFELIECKACFTVENLTKTGPISFQGTVFHNYVSFDSLEIDGVLDLVGTKFTHQLSLHGLSCTLYRENGGRKALWTKIATDKKNIARLNRLKELADSNKHHELALHFHANEHRARRWNTVGFWTSIVDATFSAICDYGQSIWRPFLIWLASIPVFASIYMMISPTFKFTVCSGWKAIIFSAANSLPFVSSSKSIRDAAQTPHFELSGQLSFISPIIMIQGVLSVVFIFLIGLGLRNWFRL
jgi:uncharacterized protein YjbI with pentapeptide repeats